MWKRQEIQTVLYEKATVTYNQPTREKVATVLPFPYLIGVMGFLAYIRYNGNTCPRTN